MDPSFPPTGVAGCDLGATLTKIVTRSPGAGNGEGLKTDRFPSQAAERLRAFLSAHRPELLGATGGGAAGLPDEIEGAKVVRVSEFDAWARGARLTASSAGVALPEEALVVSLGTGVSILHLRGQAGARIGGTALGGGALHGLGRMLLGTEHFATLADLAARGDRTAIDLTVGDVYAHGDGGLAQAGLSPDLTAANFGKLASLPIHELEAADLAHALIGLVGENVALLACAFAASRDVGLILYCGTPVEASAALAQVLLCTTDLLGRRGQVLPRGAYAGALGAAVLAAELAGRS